MGQPALRVHWNLLFWRRLKQPLNQFSEGVAYSVECRDSFHFGPAVCPASSAIMFHKDRRAEFAANCRVVALATLYLIQVRQEDCVQRRRRCDVADNRAETIRDIGRLLCELEDADRKMKDVYRRAFENGIVLPPDEIIGVVNPNQRPGSGWRSVLRVKAEREALLSIIRDTPQGLTEEEIQQRAQDGDKYPELCLRSDLRALTRAKLIISSGGRYRARNSGGG